MNSKNSSSRAILAAGCFWGVEQLLRNIPGVLDTTVGYTGGAGPANYQAVCQGTTGHFEAIEVVFDSTILSYQSLLKYFFKLHDPTQVNGQGHDIGPQYRSAIFYLDQSQKDQAQALIQVIAPIFEKPIATKLLEAKEFYPAEEYHQDYLLKNPNGYTCHYFRALDF